MNIQQLLNNESIPTKIFREKFFFDLCHLLCEVFVFLFIHEYLYIFIGWIQILN